MKLVNGLILNGQTVDLDNHQFVDCQFTGCTLNYSGRPVSFSRTALVGCRYTFFGAAKMTLEFLDCVGLMPEDQHPAASDLTARVH